MGLFIVLPLQIPKNEKKNSFFKWRTSRKKKKSTRATIKDAHHAFYLRFQNFGSFCKTSPKKQTDLDKKYNCYHRMKKSYGLCAQREPCKNKLGLFSQDVGLKSPVIQKLNSQKTVYLNRSMRQWWPLSRSLCPTRRRRKKNSRSKQRFDSGADPFLNRPYGKDKSMYGAASQRLRTPLLSSRCGTSTLAADATFNKRPDEAYKGLHHTVSRSKNAK